MTQQHALVAANLACGYRDHALFSNLDLCVQAGDTVRIRGDNGAGKTTLLRALAGLHPPLAGRVEWQPGGPCSMYSSICFIEHANALNARLSAADNLRFLLRLAGHRVSSARVRALLNQLGLGPVAHRLSARLSAGQQRRVALARLWLDDAPLWLLDEPAAALDAPARVGLAARIRAHVDAGGLVVYTTHEPLDLPATRDVWLSTPC